MQVRGVTVILGDMAVARVNPYRSCQSEPLVHMAWFASPRPTTVPNSEGRSRSAYYPVDDVHQAGSHRASEDGGGRGPVRPRTKGGSVEVSHQYLGKYNDMCWSFMQVRVIFLAIRRGYTVISASFGKWAKEIDYHYKSCDYISCLVWHFVSLSDFNYFQSKRAKVSAKVGRMCISMGNVQKRVNAVLSRLPTCFVEYTYLQTMSSKKYIVLNKCLFL